MKDIAAQFGMSLDKDDFATTKLLLGDDCRYVIGEEVLVGPDAICQSYEDNMIAGRKKLDKLEWGQSRIEELGGNKFYVHFTDHLGHKGVDYTHRCKQKLTIDTNGKIISIEHIYDQDEQDRLDAYYRSVGLK